MIRILIGAVSLLMTALLIADSLPTAAQDASPEQCTCDLQGFSTKTGADVVNAATCVLELRHPWCDIYLAAMEDTEAHQTLVAVIESSFSANDIDYLEVLLLELYDRYLRAIPDRQEEHGGIYADDREYIETKVEEVEEVMLYCIKMFLVRDSVTEELEGFSCSVGSVSGWLNLEFRNEDRTYRFLFAPA